MNNRFVLVLAVCVVAFFGIMFATKKDKANDQGSKGGQPSSHIFSQGSTGVTLTEYGDYECPACYRFFPVIEQVKEKYKGKITFQFKNFPLVEIHQHALIAARAAEAASIQGKFWEMYIKLYSEQPTWSKNSDPTIDFASYANQLGLDVDKFNADLKSEAVNNIIQADLGEAKSKGYNSTPTFEIDGKQVSEPRDTLEFFSTQIDKAIAEKAKTSK